MKIQGTCNTCGRSFLLSQISADSDAPGRCPFCGARFARHYSPLLIESVEEAEIAAERFISAIRRLQDMDTGFELDTEEFLQTVDERIRRHEQPAAS